MFRTAALVVLVLTAGSVCAETPPDATEVARLVKQLGSADYREREAASKRLEEIGPDALESLRIARKSEDPEVVRRAAEIIRKVERKQAIEKVLAPTLVQLDARDRPLDTVLADLSRQAHCEVVLGGAKAMELATRKLTISTGGNVPFWSAVLKICETADLQVAMVGGYVAPGAAPYRPRGTVRFARNANSAVVLEARDPASPRRPAAVHGAVLIEVVPFPATASAVPAGTALVQVWPEPRLQWQSMWNIRVSRAVDDRGDRLRGEFVTPPAAPPTKGGDVVVIRNPDGSVTLARAGSSGFQVAGAFSPNPLQAVVRFRGETTTPRLLRDLDLTLYATVRSSIEPLSQIQDLRKNQMGTGKGDSDVELSARFETDGNGDSVAVVTVQYNSPQVQPANLNDEIPAPKGTVPVFYGNQTVHGIMVTDRNGKPFVLGLKQGASTVDAKTQRFAMRMTLELVPRAGMESPSSVTFWGTHPQHLDIAVSLKSVPLR